MQLPDLATTEEFAQSTKCSTKTIRKNYCLTGHCYGIRPVKVGGRLLWPVSDIVRLLNGEILEILSDRASRVTGGSHEF